MTVTAGDTVDVGTPIEFIGANGMFITGAGSTIVKDYIPAEDRLVLETNGDATLASIVLDMSDSPYASTLRLVLKTDKIDSSSFILSINGGMRINVNSGTITVAQDVSMLPGLEVNIAEGATMYLEENFNAGILNTEADNKTGFNAYVFDSEDWGNYVFPGYKFHTAQYSPSANRVKRTSVDDVKIDVNGTVDSDGYLYTTQHGASIISSKGTGKIVMNNGAGIAQNVYRIAISGQSMQTGTTPVVSAMLKNADGSYTETAGAEAGAAFTYCAECGKWNKTITVTFEANAAEGETATGKMEAQTIEKACCTKLTANAFQIEGKKFTGWSTAADGIGTEENPAAAYADEAVLTGVEENITLYAQWEADGLKGDVDKDGQILASDATALARHLAKIEIITDPAMLKNADTNGDGTVGAADATKLARYLARIITDWDQE